MIKTKSLLALLVTALFLVGCGTRMPSENDQRSSYESGAVAATEEDMFQFTETGVPDGYFIKKGDYFYPLLNYGTGTINSKTYQWFQNYEKFIPELSAGDKLVLVSSSSVPDSFKFSKMEDLGTSIGMFFNVDGRGNSDVGSSNNRITKSNVVNKGSASAKVLGILPPESIFTDIKSKDGLHALTGDMFTNDGVIKGLSKDKPYELKFYLGTKFEEVVLVADTRIFVAENTVTTSETKKMQNVYFEVELPANMETGYYVLGGAGSFFYNGNQ